jgi:hypothetical protein
LKETSPLKKRKAPLSNRRAFLISRKEFESVKEWGDLTLAINPPGLEVSGRRRTCGALRILSPAGSVELIRVRGNQGGALDSFLRFFAGVSETSLP